MDIEWNDETQLSELLGSEYQQENVVQRSRYIEDRYVQLVYKENKPLDFNHRITSDFHETRLGFFHEGEWMHVKTMGRSDRVIGRMVWLDDHDK